MTRRADGPRRDDGHGGDGDDHDRDTLHRADTGVAGIVIAGGRSRRFGGRDKALARLGDRPVVRHVVEALFPVVDEVIVNCRRDQRRAIESALTGTQATVVGTRTAGDAPDDDGVAAEADAPVAGDEGVIRFATDPIVDRGPVCGLRTALRATDARYAVACACDMPLLDPGLLSFLVARGRNGTGAVASLDGERQPLPAVLHVRVARSACTDTLTRGSGRLSELVDRLDLSVVPEREVLAYTSREAFLSVDTWSDLQAAVDAL